MAQVSVQLILLSVGASQFTEYNGHSYKLYTLDKTYSDAKADCENNGGYLTEITSQEEDNFIKGNKTLQTFCAIRQRFNIFA